MYIKKKYSIKDMVMWTRWETYVFIAIAVVITALFELVELRWLQIPWTPVAMVGTAVAFLISFQNNAAYDRIWEARKIWGGIVNFSRTWTMMVKDMVNNEHAPLNASDEELHEQKRILVHRHIAWLTALRYAMRQNKPWETFASQRTNKEWLDLFHTPEFHSTMEENLKPLLSEKELSYVLSKTNKAATLLSLQSQHIRQLKDQGHIWEFSFLELENVLKEFFNLQGKSERIKNFPYPRQYATLGYDFVRVFLILLPFAVIPEFSKLGEALSASYPGIGPYIVWLGVPFSVIVSWIFHTMQRIGTVGENPFEGSANDVPISTIARGIEIDIREMLDEDEADIPKQFEAHYNVQM